MHDTPWPSQALQAHFLVPTDNSEYSVGTENSQACRGRGRPRGSHTDRTMTLKLRCTPAEHRLLLGLLAQVHLDEYPQERPVATILVQALQEHANIRQARKEHK